MQKEYDVIVVGSGASGGWAAKELSEQGLEVLVLEAGRKIEPERDYPSKGWWPNAQAPWPRVAAALRGQQVQARCGGFAPRKKHFYVNDRENPYTLGRGSKFLWFRGRQEGGRLHTWGRISPRMSDLDFAAASFDGYGRDWPISYKDLAPYYDRVETFFGLYGSGDGIPHFPDGRFLATWPFTSQEIAFGENIKSEWPERRIASARIMRQDARIPPTLIAARATGRCETRYNSVVKKIETDSKANRARSVRFIDTHSRQEHSVEARAVVLCSSTIETIRILLNSGSARHPNGLANSSGLLGTGFMDNTFVYRWGRTQESDPKATGGDPYDPSIGVGFFLPQFRNVKEKDAEFIRGYAVCGSIGRSGKTWWMSCFGSMLPYTDNRVTLSRRKKDAWSIPAAHIDLHYHENEWAMITDQKRSLDEMMRAGDLTASEWGSRLQRPVNRMLMKMVSYERDVFYPGSAIHECGGAAMGSDPGTSVLNSFNQCWDVPNLFVTDGSCFVTCPAVNLTNTIMALTVRASDHIARMFSSGDL